MKDIYFRFALKRPAFYPVIFKIIFQKAIRYLRRRFLKSKLRPFNNKDFNTTQRKEIAAYAKNIKIPQISTNSIRNLPTYEFNFKKGYCDISSISIPLATQPVNLTDNFFNIDYEDPEDYFAANRFIWLYEILLSHPYENVINYCYNKILEWIGENPEVTEDKRFESYSISERTIAFLFFFQFTKGFCKYTENEIERVVNSIIDQLNHLLSHLEYRGDKTNNHILNNARALYVAGRLLKIPEIELLAKKILTNELSLVFDNGIYQEGSSHYQFLLTKNFLEMNVIAEYTRDLQFQETFQKTIYQMILQCDLLQSRYSSTRYPLFGDISPDMAPDWFIGEPFSVNSTKVSKWASLFKYQIQDSLIEISDLQTSSIEGLDARWLFLEKDGFEVWSTIRNNKIPGHGHNDNGSVVVYFKGRPIIIDPGLSTYLNGQKKENQVGYFAHNMPVVDFFPPDAPKNSISSSLIDASRVFGVKINKDILEYNVQYAKKSIGIKRQIYINNASCIIIDINNQSHRLINYEASWVFAEKPILLSQNTFIVENSKIEFYSDYKIQFQIDELCNRSVQYGELLPSFRLIVGTKFKNNGIKMIITN